MIIAHNLMANFTERQLNINNKSKNSALEKLSTGYKINRAADDAAGLSISEKMRAQIRGLNRGAQNTTEGINMINTAEGGINEQIEILQRIRELTIQSYNDTNTQDDRFDIQMEVDALLEEIDRIANDTEFNTIKVLQGDRETVRTDIIQPSEKYTEISYIVPSQRTFPAWATCDAKLELNNPKVAGTNLQDTSEYVIFNENQAADPNSPQTAYGPKPSDTKAKEDNWQKEWTDTMTDNYSAVVDFSEIATLKTKDDLYSHLNDLVGTGIGYECYTCPRTQGVCFESDDIKVNRVYNDERSSSFPVVNLQSCINKVDDLYDEDVFNALSQAEQVALGGTYDVYVNEAAKKITEEIVDKIVNKTQYKEHFVRTKENTENPYQVIFYDFRDNGSAAAGALEGDVLKTVTVDVVSKVKVENQPVELTAIESSGYYIQVAANSFQGVEINFPDTRLAAIDMEGYTVFPDGYCSITKDKKYDPSLMIGAEQIGEHLYRNEVGGTPPTPVSEEYTVTKTKKVYEYGLETIPGRPAGTDANGEYVPAKASITRTVIIGEKEVPYTSTYTVTKYVGGTPGEMKEFYAYLPDTLLRVDRAISSLSQSRSYLGAMTNRLEHTYLNDTNSSENLQSAESRIRDADMAEEMVALARDNILEQAGISMLTQANQISEGILQLLR